MIDKISPHPSLPKRGREKEEMTHSNTRRAKIIRSLVGLWEERDTPTVGETYLDKGK